jgi:GTP-dependent phosphoenolpyruvate carboxykinase
MVEISAAEAARNFSRYREKAESEPVVVMHYNKPSVVMISANEFERLKRRDRKVMPVEEMPDWLAALVINGKMDVRHDELNSLRAPADFEDRAATES